MNPDAPSPLRVITPNDDGTFSLKVYKFDPDTRERQQIGESELYRVATESDREAHARGELKGRTQTGYNPNDFTFFLLVKMDKT